MSDLPTDYQDRLDLREQIERIDRQREESRKFIAEQRKMDAEQRKLDAEQRKMEAEQRKLDAEAMKLLRDRAFAPWMVVATLLGTGAALFAAGAGFIKLIGG